MQNEGAFSSLSIYMTLPNNSEEMVWTLEAVSPHANMAWQQGRVQLTARKARFQVVKAGAEQGWAAIDDLEGLEWTEGMSCETLPAESAVTTTPSTESTTSQQGNQRLAACRKAFFPEAIFGLDPYSSLL